MNFERKTRQILIILHYVPLYLPLKLSLFIGIARTERKPKWTDNWTISFANVFTEMKTRPLFNSNLQIFIIHKIFYFNLISSPSKTQGIFFLIFFCSFFALRFIEIKTWLVLGFDWNLKFSNGSEVHTWVKSARL